MEDEQSIPDIKIESGETLYQVEDTRAQKQINALEVRLKHNDGYTGLMHTLTWVGMQSATFLSQHAHQISDKVQRYVTQLPPEQMEENVYSLYSKIQNRLANQIPYEFNDEESYTKEIKTETLLGLLHACRMLSGEYSAYTGRNNPPELTESHQQPIILKPEDIKKPREPVSLPRKLTLSTLIFSYV